MELTSRSGMEFNPFLKNSKEIIFEGNEFKEAKIRLETLAKVKGFELSPLSLNPHRKEVSATVFSLVTGKSQVFTIIFFFQFFS